MEILWTPVFEKDDVRFLLAYSDMLAKTESEAEEIGMNVEDEQGVEIGFRYSGVYKVEEFNAIRADLGGLDVLVISGLGFDKPLNPENE